MFRSLFFQTLALTFLCAMLQPYDNGPPIRSDGVGYHIWTRALLTGKFDFCGWTDASHVDIADALIPIDPVGGRCINKYPPGVAILRLPFMAPFIDLNAPWYSIGVGEHWMSLFLGWLAYALIGFFSLRALEGLRVPRSIASVAFVLGSLGTGLFHYATYDSSFSHIYSALCLSLLAWLLMRPFSSHRLQMHDLAIVGATCLAILVRNTNVIAISWGALALLILSRRRWSESLRILAPLASGVALGASFQLVYNRVVTGSFTLSSYVDEAFLWNRPMWRSVLLSYERGLFTYYPIMAAFLITGLLVKATRLAAVIFGAAVLSYSVLYGYWHSWPLGGGFGHRGFVEVVPGGILLFAVAMEHAAPRFRSGLLISGLVCCWATTKLMWGYWKSELPHAGTTHDRYWANLVEYQPTFAIGLTSLLFLVWHSATQGRKGADQ